MIHNGHDSTMRKARWSRAAILVMNCTAADGFQQATRSADSQREKNVDAIYSLMTTNPETPPIGREADLQEVLADFESRRAVRRQLKPSTEELSESIWAKLSLAVSEAKTIQYRGETDLFTLTDVYFI